MKKTLLGIGLLVQMATVSAEEIHYVVVKPLGYSDGVLAGKTAYRRKDRGTLDSLMGVEVIYQNDKKALPPPTVVPHSNLPVVNLVKADSHRTRRIRRGEDAVFEQIAIDIERDRCVLNPRSCQPRQEQPQTPAAGNTDSSGRKYLKP